MLQSLGIAVETRDERELGAALDVSFVGELAAEQRAAAEALLRHDICVTGTTATIVCPCRFSEASTTAQGRSFTPSSWPAAASSCQRYA